MNNIISDVLSDLLSDVISGTIEHSEINKPQIQYDHYNNMLIEEHKILFRNSILFTENYIFTDPINTTNTIEGVISDVSFMESEFIKLVEPDSNIVIYHCNYGKKIHSSYSEIKRTKLTNRGRKKKPKKIHRKKQGDGTAFNSQVSCHTRENENSTVYKIKLFRTGKIQIPGVKRQDIDIVIGHINRLTDVVNNVLHNGEDKSSVIYVTPSMKNYKFKIKLPPNYIVDRNMLHLIISREAQYEKGSTWDSKNNNKIPKRVNIKPPAHPPIFSCKFSREENALSIKFSTPIYRKLNKYTCVNIFMRGKVGLLGGYNISDSTNICNFLHWIIATYYYSVVVKECGFNKIAPELPNKEYIAGLLSISLADIYI